MPISTTFNRYNHEHHHRPQHHIISSVITLCHEGISYVLEESEDISGLSCDVVELNTLLIKPAPIGLHIFPVVMVSSEHVCDVMEYDSDDGDGGDGRWCHT